MERQLQVWDRVYLGGILFFNLLAAAYILPVDDEMYYWTWSHKLDWGYFDHPPLVALYIFLSKWMDIGHLQIRLVSVISFVFFLLIWRRILEPKETRTLHIFYALMFSFTAFQVFSFVTSPDTPFILFASLYLLFLKQFLKQPNHKNTLLLGLSMAMVMYSKYFGFLLIVFSLIPLINRLFKNKEIYLAIAFGIFLFTPQLWWQYSNDWVSIRYHLMDRNHENYFSWNKFTDYFFGMLFFGSIPLLFINFYTTLWKSQSSFFNALKGIAILSFLLFFSLGFTHKVQAQWNLITYLALLPFAFESLRKISLNNWKYKFLLSFAVLFFMLKLLLMYPFSFTPMYKLKDYIQRVSQKIEDTPSFERYQHTAAYQYYTDSNSYCYRVYNHRPSQYDLWKDEERMQGKSFTSIGIERFSDDTLVDNENNVQNLVKINDFHSYPKVQIEIIEAKYATSKEELYLHLKVKNPYSNDIPIRKEAQQLVLIGFNRKVFPVWIVPLEIEKELAANSSFHIQLHQKINIPENIEKFALGLRPPKISAKKQSEFFLLFRTN